MKRRAPNSDNEDSSDAEEELDAVCKCRRDNTPLICKYTNLWPPKKKRAWSIDRSLHFVVLHFGDFRPSKCQNTKSNSKTFSCLISNVH